MMNKTESTESREVTVKELVAAFDGKYVNVSPLDHYGIAIEIHKGTIEFEDDLKPELYLVSRDDEDRVTASICIDEDSICDLSLSQLHSVPEAFLTDIQSSCHVHYPIDSDTAGET